MTSWEPEVVEASREAGSGLRIRCCKEQATSGFAEIAERVPEEARYRPPVALPKRNGRDLR
jgi:hypothetical protein